MAKYTRATATAQLKKTPGRLIGMYVNSTSSGTIKFYDSLDNSGPVINNTITPAVGYHNLGDVSFATACYFEIGGTLDVTLHWE